MFSSVRSRSVYVIIIIMIIRGFNSDNLCGINVDNPRILETCDELSAVKEIHFEDIPFNTFNHDLFAKCSSTITLELHNVSLSNVSACLFKGMSSLQSLSLNNNLIKILNNETFGDMPDLRRIFVNNNVISSIGEDSFKRLRNLRAVYITHNSLDKVDKYAFPADNRLTWLDFSNNHLKRLNFIQNLHSLKTLYLPFNKIKRLENDTFLNLVELEYLDLKYNLIEELPTNLFRTQKRLQEIDLSHNRLVQIETGTFGIGFSTLLLNDNKLAIIAVFNDIAEVNIARNNLRELSALPTNNVTLTIDKNPWECQFIHQVTNQRNINLKYTSNNETKNLRGIPCNDTLYEAILSEQTTPSDQIKLFQSKNEPKISNGNYYSPRLNNTNKNNSSQFNNINNKNSSPFNNINNNNNDHQHFWSVFSLHIILAVCVLISLLLIITIVISYRKEKKILPKSIIFEERSKMYSYLLYLTEFNNEINLQNICDVSRTIISEVNIFRFSSAPSIIHFPRLLLLSCYRKL